MDLIKVAEEAFASEKKELPRFKSGDTITVSYRIAEGGMEFVKIYSVRSIPRLLEALKNRMVRIGTDLSARSKFASDIKSITKGKPAVVVLGNEENGISKEVKQNCDELVLIPFAPSYHKVVHPRVHMHIVFVHKSF